MSRKGLEQLVRPVCVPAGSHSPVDCGRERGQRGPFRRTKVSQRWEAFFCLFPALRQNPRCVTLGTEGPSPGPGRGKARGVPRREVDGMKLFTYADRYLKQSSWKDLALVKFCLCAIGVLLGLAVPRSRRRQVAFGALVVFATTYVPLMAKFLHVVMQTRREEQLTAAAREAAESEE